MLTNQQAVSERQWMTAREATIQCRMVTSCEKRSRTL